MFPLIILIQITLQQQLTHQILRPQKINQELISDRMDCKYNQSIISDICNNCKAKHAYILDEQNWLIFGVYHEFGKEYKELIESIQKYYQKGIIYATFNQEFICLSIQDANVNLEEFLNNMYYYQLPKSFYPLDKHVRYNQTNNNFTITNFVFNGYSKTDRYLLQLSNYNVTINNHNVTLNKSGILLDNSQTNQIQLYQNVVGSKYQNEVLKLHFQQFEQGIQGFIHENFAPYYQDVINIQKMKNLKSELTVKISKEKNANKKKYNLYLSFD
ncbi:unnamed protein product [Paramecium pentaurelia]|uniref:Uncharacterized protein n=1 Tax=Paramecium pentaurelia TaxID=43138 RepID=A0A8S1X5S4_9CILI|nr:unnamed protein product [Paramecium pentaurelia]